MPLNDRTANRKTHPHTVSLGGEEGIEYAIELIWGNADAGVSHRDQGVVPIVLAHSNHELALIRNIGHGFDAVQDEVDDDLLQLHAVTEDRVKARIKVEPQLHPIIKHLALHQADDVMDQIVDIERSILRVGLFGQSTQALDHLAGAVAVADQALHG